jgi:ribosomal protein S18 acetylase RimI-like enzyme
MSNGDYDGVRALWDSTPGVGLNSLDDSREGIEKYLKRNPSSCFVATDGDEIVGSVMSGHDGRRGMIYHMAVKHEFRRNGVGKRLADAALAALRAEGITKVMLVAMKSNEAGNSFWESLGFTKRDDLVFRNLRIIG